MRCLFAPAAIAFLVQLVITVEFAPPTDAQTPKDIDFLYSFKQPKNSSKLDINPIQLVQLIPSIFPFCPSNPDEAAIFWLDQYAPLSRSRDNEIGGQIVPCNIFLKGYTMTDTIIGSRTEVDLDPPAWVQLNPYWKGMAHTHNYGERNSLRDKISACKHNVPIYVRGPSGKVYKYTPPALTPRSEIHCTRAIKAGQGKEIRLR